MKTITKIIKIDDKYRVIYKGKVVVSVYSSKMAETCIDLLKKLDEPKELKKKIRK